jgi:isoquinoline 1-oxidoreductase beta subunit
MSGRRASFGALASAAAQLPPPTDATLKDPKDFTLIGARLPRIDLPASATAARAIP